MIVLFNCRNILSIISATRLLKGDENSNENCHECKVTMQKNYINILNLGKNEENLFAQLLPSLMTHIQGHSQESKTHVQ